MGKPEPYALAGYSLTVPPRMNRCKNFPKTRIPCLFRVGIVTAELVKTTCYLIAIGLRQVVKATVEVARMRNQHKAAS